MQPAPTTIPAPRFCICGIHPGPAFVPDARTAWRHLSFCPHASASACGAELATREPTVRP